MTSKEVLIEELWEGRAVSDSALTRAVSLARKALRTDQCDNPIVSVYGTGYRLAPNSGQGSVRSARRAGDAEAGLARGTGRLASRRSRARRPVPDQLPGFVGRKAELSALGLAADYAQQGNGSLHFVTGEAGIGKTRLCDEVIRLASRRGLATRIGRCAESDGAPSFWPWVQILRAEVAARGFASLEALGGPSSKRLERMLSNNDASASAALREADSDANDRFTLFDTVSRYLARAVQERPMLIVIDDLHRADRSSLALLQFLAPQLGTLSLMVLGTYRELDLQRRQRARRNIAETARAGGALFHPLSGFDEGDVGAFLERSTTHARLTRILHAKTGGNPLFLTHLATILARTPGLDDEAAIAKLAADLPPALRDAIDLQLDGLSEACRGTLTIASVAGGEFDLEALYLASKTPRSRLLELVEEGVRAGLIVELRAGDHAGYRFAHILVRDHLYEGLGARERATLHLALARGLQNRQTPSRRTELATIAHHSRNALPIGDVAEAVDYSVRAGTVAQEQSAYEEAAWQYEQALAALEARSLDQGHDRRCGELLLALSAARIRAGDREGARQSCRAAVRLARQLNAADLLARAAFTMSPGFLSIETALYDDELVALLEEALAANRTADSALRARLLSRLATALYWSESQERSRDLSEEALGLIGPDGDPGTLAYALHALHGARWRPENVDERITLARRAVSIAGGVGDPEATLLYRTLLIADLAEKAAISELDWEIQRFAAAARELRQPQSLWLAPMFLAMRALMEGRFNEVPRIAAEYLEIGRRIQSEDAENASAGQIFMAYLELGQGRAFLPFFVAHERRHPKILIFRAAGVWIKAELGKQEEARAELDAYAAVDFESVPRDMNWLGNMLFLAMASAELEERRSSELLLEILSPYASCYGLLGHGTLLLGSVAAHLGRLAAIGEDWCQADQHFAHGEAMDERVGARPWLVRSLHGRGASFLARGDNEEARRYLTRALARAQHLGMAHVEGRIREDLHCS